MDAQQSPAKIIQPLEGFSWAQNKRSDNYNSHYNLSTAIAKPKTLSSTPSALQIQLEGKSPSLMHPSYPATMHPAASMLMQYAQEGCPVDAGRAWTPEEITAAVERGPHISSRNPDAIEYMQKEVKEKVQQGFAEIVNWDDIKPKLSSPAWKNLKVSPLALVPHKSRQFRAILDLSFKLRVFDMELPSVNDATTSTAPLVSMTQLGKVLPRIIETIANAPITGGNILFSKLDIKDGYWRMMVRRGQHLNFAYVLPSAPGTPTQLVIPSALQMGWCESPPFFCAATETARDVAQHYCDTNAALPPHPLEHYMVAPNKWPQHLLPSICEQYVRLLEVYVDDFCTLIQCTDPAELLRISRALLHAIHSVFPPPSQTGHPGGDPISVKKLNEGEGLWDTRKEILGWVFDGAARCINLPTKKLDAIITELKHLHRLKAVPFKRFEKLVGKLRHAAIGLPAGKGLCAPFNRAIAQRPKQVKLGPNGAVAQAIKDWTTLLQSTTHRPTHVMELVSHDPIFVAYTDASAEGAGGVLMSITGEFPNVVWRLQWPQDITSNVVSDSNPSGTITNSDLEMAGLLLQWLVLEEVADTKHQTLLLHCDNTQHL